MTHFSNHTAHPLFVLRASNVSRVNIPTKRIRIHACPVLWVQSAIAEQCCAIHAPLVSMWIPVFVLPVLREKFHISRVQIHALIVLLASTSHLPECRSVIRVRSGRSSPVLGVVLANLVDLGVSVLEIIPNVRSVVAVKKLSMAVHAATATPASIHPWKAQPTAHSAPLDRFLLSPDL